ARPAKTGTAGCWPSSSKVAAHLLLANRCLYAQRQRRRYGPNSAQSGNRGCKGQLGEVAVLAQKMIGDQELRHCERWTVFLLGTIEVVANLIVAHRTQVGQVLPDGIFYLRSMLRGHIAVNLEKIDRAS